MVVFSLTLVRHGETKANKDGVIQGHQDVALSDVGLEQARLVANRLQNDNFTHIFASDLSRAAQTAQAIVEANTVCQCSIQLDKRLRERTFGEFEGKTFKELLEEARKNNKKCPGFTPKGAETVDEVRFRARAFFLELCETMAKAGSPVDGTYISAALKVGQSNSVGLSNGTARETDTQTPRLTSAAIQKKAEKEASTGQKNSNAETNCVEEGVASKRPRTEDARLRRLSLDEVGSRTESDSHCIMGEVLGSGGTTMARSNSSSSSGCSSLHDSVDGPEGDVDYPPAPEDTVGNSSPKSSSATTPTHQGKAHVGIYSPQPVNAKNLSTDKAQNSSAVQSPGKWDSSLSWFRDVEWSPVFGPYASPAPSPAPHACPNVSLSPMMEHRLTSMSSVSSGRNSSFDDADIVPCTVGDVLVVSHGGLIKELVAHFIEDFSCKIPGGKGHALRVCPNTGVSRFTVTVDDLDLRPNITCLLIHDKDHLRSLQDPPFRDPLFAV